MRVHRAVTAAVVATAVLTSCAGRPATPSTSPSPSATSAAPASTSADAPPATTAAPRTETWTALQTGDCLAQPPSSDPAEVMVNVVDCTGPHQAEVYLRTPIPVDAALTGTADAQCGTGFTGYTGTSPAALGYTITYLIDSDQDRTSNNPYPSTVICLLQGPPGQYLTGSARR